jgi:hypothetical protein
VRKIIICPDVNSREETSPLPPSKGELKSRIHQWGNKKREFFNQQQEDFSNNIYNLKQ